MGAGRVRRCRRRGGAATVPRRQRHRRLRSARPAERAPGALSRRRDQWRRRPSEGSTGPARPRARAICSAMRRPATALSKLTTRLPARSTTARWNRPSALIREASSEADASSSSSDPQRRECGFVGAARQQPGGRGLDQRPTDVDVLDGRLLELEQQCRVVGHHRRRRRTHPSAAAAPTTHLEQALGLEDSEGIADRGASDVERASSAIPRAGATRRSRTRR